MKKPRFWMVSGNGPTSVRHPTRALAEAEAQRLANAHPGTEFYVLGVESGFVREVVSAIEIIGNEPGDEIPF